MKSVSICAVILSLFVFSCNDSSDQPTHPTHSHNLSKQEKVFVDTNNEFAFTLFREIVHTNQPGDNAFISPLSVSYALGMAMNGAFGETQKQMRSVLAFDGLNEQEINQTYKNFMTLMMTPDNHVTFDIANSMWNRTGFDVKQDFVQVNEDYFSSEVHVLDFSAPDAADIMNAWVKKNTNGKIESIVDKPIPTYVVMYLINAIYFNGTWKYEFTRDPGSDYVFHGIDGDTDLGMMKLRTKLSYAQTPDYQAIELPYGNGAYSMVIVLPSDADLMAEMQQSLNPVYWNTILASLTEKEGTLRLPKFKLECDYALPDILKTMGMPIAFTSQADFSRINDEGDLLITNIKHKTYVDVHEKGTEAAAVTSIEFGRGETGFNMLVNKPFIFAIRESNTNAILFLGRVNNL